jgi:dTDP-4-dehydrorhamnose reductase
LIVNAAAYTAVDQAESEPQLAFAVNATAPGVLAEEAAALGAPLIHYSTDYAYNATGRSSWRTGTAPCSSAWQARVSPPRLSLEALNLLLQAGR